jgi:hypothetical protein
VRSELQGEQPETIGAKTYVRPFSRAAERRVEWRATRHILSVSAEGAADLEELLDDFGAASAPSSSPADADAKKLDQSLESVIGKWIEPGSRTLRYRETSTGQLSGLSPDAVPALDEASPPFLALWLLRALRPATALPARPVQFDVRCESFGRGATKRSPRRERRLPCCLSRRGNRKSCAIELTGYIIAKRMRCGIGRALFRDD